MEKVDLVKLMRSRRDKAAAEIRAIIRRNHGNYSAAAREIGVTYVTLRRWRILLEADGYKLESAAA